MPRTEAITIDLDRMTAQDWADARAIAAEGMVDLAAVDLADPPIPALTALIYCALRRDEPRVTPGRCVRLARAAWEAAHGE